MEIITVLGWMGWLIGVACVMAFLYQRDVNKQRELDSAKKKADDIDVA